jgi:hypothetical protein
METPKPSPDLNREHDLPFRRYRKAKIVVDPLTALPVLTAGPEVPPLSSKEVREILSEFP